MMMPLKILIAEHDAVDVELITFELTNAAINFTFEVVQNEWGYTTALREYAPDIILCDFTFPSFSGLEAFQLRQQILPGTPFFIVSGTIGEENSIELIKTGVTDYVLKERLFTLPGKLNRAVKESIANKEKELILQRLLTSEARLAQAQSIARLGSWEINLPGNLTTWSMETFRIFGLDPANYPLSAPDLLDFVHADDLLRVRKRFQNELTSQTIQTIEHRIITPAGTIKYLEQQWQTFEATSGLSYRVVGTCQDVTDRKAAERRSSENAARYRAFFENSLDGILLTEPNGNILAANRAACEMFAMTEKEIFEQGRLGLVDLSDPRVPELIQQRQLTGEARGALTLKRKGGDTFPGEISSKIFSDSFGCDLVSMIVKDVTESKQAEEQLAVTSDHLRQTVNDLSKILNSSLDIICTIDEAGRFVSVSAAATAILGYSPGELTGKKYIELVCKEDVENTRVVAASIMSGIPETIFQNRYLKKDGSIVPIMWSATWDDNDQLMYCIAKDATEKCRLEQALENERKRLTELFTHAPLAIVALRGANHTYEIANNLYLDFIGKTSIVGKTVAEILPGAHEFSTILKDVYQTGNTHYIFEKLVQHQKIDGGEVLEQYMNFIYQAYRNIHEEVEGIFVFVIDVTDQVQSRKTIEDSEQRYRQIVETAQEGIWVLDALHKTTFVNKKLAEILECPAPDLIGKSMYEFMDAEARQIAADTIKLRMNGIAGQQNFKYLTASGKEVWTNVSSNPLFDGNGNYMGALAMITDISAAVKAKEHDRFLATLLNTIGQSVIAADTTGNVIFWNKAAEEIYGWSRDEAIGNNIIPLIFVNQEPDEARATPLQLQDGQSASGEYYLKRKNGESFPAFVTSAPIFDHQHQLTGIIAVSSDFTERKQAEIRLKELNEHLKQQTKALEISNAELEQFAYVASHDLQEPLRMIAGFLTLIDDKYAGLIDDKGKKYIAFAVEGAKQMRIIINDLLEFSRIGKISDKKELIDLNQLLNEIKFLYQKQLEDKAGVITFENLPVINANKTALRQVFQNLVSNALKYSKQDVPAAISVTVVESLTGWQFEISDNGIGMDPQYFEKIFILFQRLHNKASYSGTGIGLAITKKIVEFAGGRIWVTSKPGVGSTFLFTLPKCQL